MNAKVDEGEDRGQGDTSMYSAKDLEKLYRKNAVDPSDRIQGSSLNQMLKVATYDADAWYRVTAQGVEKVD